MKDHNIQFQIIGGGQDQEKIKKIAAELGLKNITWIDRVAYEELPNYINKADICLGGFGDTRKANMVSMNKLFEYMACGKAIINGDSPAVREILTDGETAIFCVRASAQDLANKIIMLKNDRSLLERISVNARKLFEDKYTPRIIVKKLIEDLSNV